jgi:MEDS: MEthanogen/methylotroph, DcmR Sensory domain
MKPDAASISLAGSSLGDIRHVCAFFNSDDEEYRVLLPFMKDGFDCGHKAIHIVNPEQRADHLHRLATAGIDTTAAAARGQFETAPPYGDVPSRRALRSGSHAGGIRATRQR